MGFSGPALAIECSGNSGSIALATQEAAELVWLPPNVPTAKSAAPAIEELLQKHSLRIADLEAVVVTIGPGSFTGLRIGIGLARALAFACDIKIIGVSSLATLAHDFTSASNQRGHEEEKLRFVTCMNAYRNELFIAAWQYAAQGLERIAPDQRIGRNDLETWAQDCFPGEPFLIATPEASSFFRACSQELQANVQTFQPTALGTLQSLQDGNTVYGLDYVLPAYFRGSAAEEKRDAAVAIATKSAGKPDTE